MLINKGIELSEKVKTWKRKGEGMIVKLVAGVKNLFGDKGQGRATGDQWPGTGTWSEHAFYTVDSVTFGLQIGGEAGEMIMVATNQKAIIRSSRHLVSVHPETPDETLLVSNSETRDFSSWQGNQGVARRRTSVRRTNKPED
jgi:hypothetical protein